MIEDDDSQRLVEFLSLFEKAMELDVKGKKIPTPLKEKIQQAKNRLSTEEENQLTIPTKVRQKLALE